MPPIRLGVNIDHVATLRNARGGEYPCPIQAAKLAQQAGAHGITAHLREDRRHIKDADIKQLKNEISLPLNLEMAATQEMLEIALTTKPNACCIVPEKREELTTEGGLDVITQQEQLAPLINSLQKEKIRVSLFIDPDPNQLQAAKELNADIIELHTGPYCDTKQQKTTELNKIAHAAKLAQKLSIECHAGHGLNFDTVTPIAAINNIIELNIGHFIISNAIFTGLQQSIQHMLKLMQTAREINT